MDPLELARLRPDTPQWLDLRGFLLSGRSEVFQNPDPETGFIVRPLDFPVAVAAGEPTADVIRATVTGVDATAKAWAGAGSEDEWHLLAPPESEAAIAAALPDWRRRGVTLHTPGPRGLRGATALPDGFVVRLAAHGWAAAGWVVDHLSSALRHEYRTPPVRRTPMAAAFHAARPVAFCYAAVSSETLWDVAVDTLEGYRRRGLAGACFTALAAHQKTRGLSPVWGSLDDNAASMNLAAKLGFRPAARLTSSVRPD